MGLGTVRQRQGALLAWTFVVEVGGHGWLTLFLSVVGSGLFVRKRDSRSLRVSPFSCLTLVFIWEGSCFSLFAWRDFGLLLVFCFRRVRETLA